MQDNEGRSMPKPPKQLTTKTALITGASRGIGAAIAERFAAEGANIIICARTEEKHAHLPGSLKDTAETLRRYGGDVHIIAADLGKEADRIALADEITNRIGGVDILVNNAAANFFMPFEKISENRFRVMMELNCRAPLHLAQLLLPAMRARGGGWILNISSAVSHASAPPFTPFERDNFPLMYGMSKAALDRFTVGLAAEYYGKGIAVNGLAPVSAVATPGAIALNALPTRSMVEGVEVMAEAALALCTGDPNQNTGRVVASGDYLKEKNRTVRTLDAAQLWDGKIAGLDF
jgi:NAD(P)-dependent dehydrogenase (short-subunit alcohol dehydrogenase family)